MNNVNNIAIYFEFANINLIKKAIKINLYHVHVSVQCKYLAAYFFGPMNITV